MSKLINIKENLQREIREVLNRRELCFNNNLKNIEICSLTGEFIHNKN